MAAALLLPLFLLLANGTQSQAADLSATRGELKSAYLFNLLHFTRWPDDNRTEWRICLPPQNALYPHLNNLRGETVADLPVRIVESNDPQQWAKCHILFIPTDATAGQKAQLERLRELPVLTITDGEEMHGPRTIMFFYQNDAYLRMGIYYPRMKQSGIRISGRLLKILKVRNLQGDLEP